MPTPFDNAKYPRLAIRIPGELRDELERVAIKNKITVSEQVKQFIKIGIALQKNPAK